jgi:signal transduction histidine kinase
MDTTRLDEHRLRRLLEVGRALVSELELEPVLNRLLGVARELTGARYAALGILDENREELERFLTVGIDEETHRAIGDLPRGRGILGELIRHPAPLRLEAISDHPRSFGFPSGHPEMTTFLGTPILIRGQVWGNLYLTEKDGGPFDESDEEATIVLAEWAAIAIDNARLYEGVESRRVELERAVRGLEATTAIARAVGGATDLGRVLELVVKRARALVEARSLLILLAEGDELVVAATAGEVGAAALGSRVSAVGSVPGQVLQSGRAERLDDVSARVRLGLGELAADARTALLVPLTFRGRTSGVLVALDRTIGGPTFDAEDERLMRAIAASAAIAVATAQTVEADRLRHSLEAAEQERGRWARELHDETLQGIGALRIGLESALHTGSHERVEQAARQAADGLGEEIEKLQALITELRPAALDEIGLAAALESLAARTTTLQGIEVELQIGLESDRLPRELESTAYRLVQEGLTNVVKHAAAERALVRVELAADRLEIEVKDDGRGFDLSGTSRGFGLVGMRERATLLGGSLEISSASGAGTTVRAVLPAVPPPAAASG